MGPPAALDRPWSEPQASGCSTLAGGSCGWTRLCRTGEAIRGERARLGRGKGRASGAGALLASCWAKRVVWGGCARAVRPLTHPLGGDDGALLLLHQRALHQLVKVGRVVKDLFGRVADAADGADRVRGEAACTHQRGSRQGQKVRTWPHRAAPEPRAMPLQRHSLPQPPCPAPDTSRRCPCAQGPRPPSRTTQRLGAQEDAVHPVQHGVGHVRRLGARGARVLHLRCRQPAGQHPVHRLRGVDCPASPPPARVPSAVRMLALSSAPRQPALLNRHSLRRLACRWCVIGIPAAVQRNGKALLTMVSTTRVMSTGLPAMLHASITNCGGTRHEYTRTVEGCASVCPARARGRRRRAAQPHTQAVGREGPASVRHHAPPARAPFGSWPSSPEGSPGPGCLRGGAAAARRHAVSRVGGPCRAPQPPHLAAWVRA